jgi:hypothetical protein
MIELLIALGVLYLAYRIIANGFVYPQSQKLGCLGILGCIVAVCLGLYLVTRLAGW